MWRRGAALMRQRVAGSWGVYASWRRGNGRGKVRYWVQVLSAGWSLYYQTVCRVQGVGARLMTRWPV